MTLYSARRSVRKVADARFDLDGAEAIDFSTNIGFTARPTQVSLINLPGQSSVELFNSGPAQFEDSNFNFPHQDGNELVGIPGGGTGCDGISTITDVGLKHYFHQLQAMRGYNIGSVTLGNAPSGPASTEVTAVYNRSGVYRQFNIKLGDMRGYRYSEDQDNLFPSTDNPPVPPGNGERLRSTGNICIGTTLPN